VPLSSHTFCLETTPIAHLLNRLFIHRANYELFGADAALLGLDEIGIEIEDPFGTGMCCLALPELSAMIFIILSTLIKGINRKCR